MAKVISLLADPRYPAFVDRYMFDLTRFAIEVCDITPTWQQVELFESVQELGSRTSVSSGHGCFGKGTSIMRADGQCVAVEDVRVGDRLMGPDGASVRNVLELKRGREAMYRFTYADGTSHVFNESHILCLVATNSKGRRKTGDRITVTVREWLTWGADKKRCHAIYRSGVEEFERGELPLPIPPYIFGAWLGDGTACEASITTMDDEIRDEFFAYAESMQCGIRQGEACGRATMWHAVKPAGEYLNPIIQRLKSLGVLRAKNIPDVYLRASRQDRLELLAGLLDTDGYYDKGSSGFEITQKVEILARRIAWLARSVGCHATIKEVTKTCGNNGVSGQYWRVTIGRNVEQIPVRLARKKPPEMARQRTNLNFSIRLCEPLGEDDYYGFVLDGDSRFLGGDFTVLHNTGKTNAYSIIALWHLLCYRMSNTFLTGPRLATIHDGVWKEFATMHTRILHGPQPWVAEYLRVESEKVYIPGHKLNWFIIAKTAPRGSPENLAGSHAEWLMWLADEASGIPDANFGVIGGAMTDANNRFVLASQPTRDSGFFRETHNKLSKANGGAWNPLVFNSEESPLVSEKFIREKLAEYGGRDAVEYCIKVLGLFPENSDKYLLSRRIIENRINATATIGDDEPYGNMLIIDVAAGVYRDKTVATHVRVIGNGDRMDDDPRRVDVMGIPIFTNRLDWQDVAGMAYQYAMTLSNCTIIVDTGGQGVQFARMLERMGAPNVIRSNWGKPCFKLAYKDKFINLRAQSSVMAAQAVQDGRITFTSEHQKDLLDQGSRIPFYFDEKGRWHIVSKEDMKTDGIPSPDLWDTICMAFLEGAHYVQTDGTGLMAGRGSIDTADALERAKEELGDLA